MGKKKFVCAVAAERRPCEKRPSTKYKQIIPLRTTLALPPLYIACHMRPTFAWHCAEIVGRGERYKGVVADYTQTGVSHLRRLNILEIAFCYKEVTPTGLALIKPRPGGVTSL